MVHQLLFTQVIPASPESVWEFFATPKNLNALTPPELHFETLTDPGPMYAGQMIAYRIRLLPGVRVRWLTEITHVRPGAFFVDEQRAGPYRIWHHEHLFVARDDGVEMTDRVTYALPFGPLAAPIHRFWVRPMLERVFAFRRQQVAAFFASR